MSTATIAERRQESILAPAERRCLEWMARRLPSHIHSDHLTALALAAMLAAGAAGALARHWPAALLGISLCLAVNWFGDSLDGTLARVRQRQRPRYGFYVDHMSDTLGALALLGGLALSGYMSPAAALTLLLGYFLLAIESFLAAHAVGVFRLSFGKFGPTEMRILLAVGILKAWAGPRVTVWGVSYLFLDVAGLIAAAVIGFVLLISIGRNTAALYRAERL